MLMENKNLTHLDIASNYIGNDGVGHLTEGLQRNDTLTYLAVYICNISVEGNYS